METNLEQRRPRFKSPKSSSCSNTDEVDSLVDCVGLDNKQMEICLQISWLFQIIAIIDRTGGSRF